MKPHRQLIKTLLSVLYQSRTKCTSLTVVLISVLLELHLVAGVQNLQQEEVFGFSVSISQYPNILKAN